MDVSRTDINSACRYLEKAAEHYRRHAVGAREQNLARLFSKLSDKLKMKIFQHDLNQVINSLKNLQND